MKSKIITLCIGLAASAIGSGSVFAASWIQVSQGPIGIWYVDMSSIFKRNGYTYFNQCLMTVYNMRDGLYPDCAREQSGRKIDCDNQLWWTGKKWTPIRDREWVQKNPNRYTTAYKDIFNAVCS